MQKVNFLIVLTASIVPLIIGFIWYHPKVFGTAWMKATGITPDDGKKMNMPLIFGLTFVFSFFIAFALQFSVIHQFHIFSIMLNEPGITDPNSENGSWLIDFMARYGHNFRTFKHGALHGTIVGFLFAMPVIGVNALFERRGFKYIAINGGYWIVSCALMGGVICQWS